MAERPGNRASRLSRATTQQLQGLPSSANGSNTAADHIAVLAGVVADLAPKLRRRLIVTADGADASHDLITCLDVPGCAGAFAELRRGRWVLGKPSGYDPAPLPWAEVMDYLERLHKDTSRARP